MKLEIIQKTSQLAAAYEDNEHDPFVDLGFVDLGWLTKVENGLGIEATDLHYSLVKTFWICMASNYSFSVQGPLDFMTKHATSEVQNTITSIRDKVHQSPVAMHNTNDKFNKLTKQ